MNTVDYRALKVWPQNHFVEVTRDWFLGIKCAQQGRIQEYLIGGPIFGSERTVELFCGKSLLTETTTCFSISERRSPLTRKILLCEKTEANRSLQGTTKPLHFLISLEFSLVEKCKARFIKKNQPVNKSQTSVRSDLGGPDPLTLPLDPPLDRLSDILGGYFQKKFSKISPFIVNNPFSHSKLPLSKNVKRLVRVSLKLNLRRLTIWKF